MQSFSQSLLQKFSGWLRNSIHDHLLTNWKYFLYRWLDISFSGDFNFAGSLTNFKLDAGWDFY